MFLYGFLVRSIEYAISLAGFLVVQDIMMRYSELVFRCVLKLFQLLWCQRTHLMSIDKFRHDRTLGLSKYKRSLFSMRKYDVLWTLVLRNKTQR